MKRVRVIILGNVIGVFFRVNIKERALKLGLKGYVRNSGDKVGAVFEGKEEAIKEILDFCRKGPKGAIVKDVKVIEEEYKNEFDSFEVRY